MTDEERMQFMMDLGESNITPTDWEIDFLESILQRRPDSFSEKQKEVINQMISKYDHRML